MGTEGRFLTAFPTTADLFYVLSSFGFSGPRSLGLSAETSRFFTSTAVGECLRRVNIDQVRMPNGVDRRGGGSWSQPCSLYTAMFEICYCIEETLLYPQDCRGRQKTHRNFSALRPKGRVFGARKAFLHGETRRKTRARFQQLNVFLPDGSHHLEKVIKRKSPFTAKSLQPNGARL